MFFLFAVAVCLPALKLPGAYSILNRPTSFLRAASASPETVLPAKIEAYRVSTMVADYPAVVAAAPVSPGIDIEEGQTVALLRSDELIAEKKRAERRLELAQSRYAAATGTDSEESRIR